MSFKSKLVAFGSKVSTPEGLAHFNRRVASNKYLLNLIFWLPILVGMHGWEIPTAYLASVLGMALDERYGLQTAAMRGRMTKSVAFFSLMALPVILIAMHGTVVSTVFAACGAVSLVYTAYMYARQRAFYTTVADLVG